LRNADKQGYNPVKYQRDNNVTGYFTQKGIMPKLNCNKNGGWNYENKPRCLIRLAELYLNLAECEAALGEDAQAIEHLNIIRTRAGVPNLTTADLSTMSMTDWVRNERFIELWGEGHRYYDIRRWLIAPQTMAAGTRMGLSAYGKENLETSTIPVELAVSENVFNMEETKAFITKYRAHLRDTYTSYRKFGAYKWSKYL